MGLSGRLGRRFGQDAVARVRNTMGVGWVGSGSVGAALRCCRKWWGQRRGGRARGGMENGKAARQDADVR